ncbi:hypothetical protein PWG15_35700 (plasmid) [Ensifer adhaerens]|uniref:hypothetical protein n=1 Tax=Ensifer adhaerens TaxID=106592 RepID=UPI0023A974E7|nr:hypothetical protein [Ensifer adhaerens]WDZ81672.1 hypothetical protein PWG15_35700 [Ensifer adhaerens]
MKLRVHPERCNKAEDANLEGYYKALKAEGMPFARDNSDKYGPLIREQLTQTLYEFKTKQKTSPMAQLADLYLWPICVGGYHASNRPYQRLTDDGKLIDCHIKEDERPMLGSKYSCFENVERKAEKLKTPPTFLRGFWASPSSILGLPTCKLAVRRGCAEFAVHKSLD